jgi:hypothetical protein
LKLKIAQKKATASTCRQEQRPLRKATGRILPAVCKGKLSKRPLGLLPLIQQKSRVFGYALKDRVPAVDVLLIHHGMVICFEICLEPGTHGANPRLERARTSNHIQLKIESNCRE